MTTVVAPASGAVAARPAMWSRDFISVCLVNFCSFGSFYLLLATLPLYVIAVGGSEADVGLVMGVFAISALLVRPFAGLATDRLGRKPVLVVAMAGMVVSSLLYLPAAAVWALLAVRVIHGMAFAGVSTAAGTYMADIVPPARRAEGVSYYGMATNLALAVGPWLSLLVAGAIGFGAVFLMSAAVAATGVVLALAMRARPFAARSTSLRWWSTLLHTTALRPATVFLCFGVTYSAQVSFLPVYAVSQGLGDPGLYFTVYAIVLVVSRPFAGKLADRYGRGLAIVPGLLLATISMVLVASASSMLFLVAAGALYALSFALVTPALNALLVDAVAPSERGAALATFTASMDVGIGGGAFLWGFVAQQFGFSTLYLVASAVPLLAIALYFTVVRGRLPVIPAVITPA